ncbi:RmlC-like cupin domain-containing protein [Aspergillus californicus]
MLFRIIVSFTFFLLNLTSSEPISTIVNSDQASGINVSPGGENFDGDAWIDEFHSDNEITMANVVISPSARTHWHTHSRGQLLRVIAGSGWVCDEGGEPEHLNVGDIVWCPPGITHWHGADNGSFFIHQAIAFGSTEWLAAV